MELNNTQSKTQCTATRQQASQDEELSTQRRKRRRAESARRYRRRKKEERRQQQLLQQQQQEVTRRLQQHAHQHAEHRRAETEEATASRQQHDNERHRLQRLAATAEEAADQRQRDSNRHRERRQLKEEDFVLPSINISCEELKAFLYRYDPDDIKWNDSRKSLVKALALMYVNAGCLRFDEYKHYCAELDPDAMSDDDNPPLRPRYPSMDIAALQKEILDERLSSDSFPS